MICPLTKERQNRISQLFSKKIQIISQEIKIKEVETRRDWPVRPKLYRMKATT
jgi:hypothetical protein